MAIRTPPPGSVVTLVEGGSFCVSGPAGDISDAEAGVGHGLYVADRRLLSRLVMTVNGHPVEPVDHHRDDPAAATFVGQLAQGAGAGIGPAIVRRRTLGTGLRDHVEVRNLGDEPSYVEIEIDLGADLATVASVRAGGPVDEPVEPAATTAGEVLLVRGKGTTRVGCRV
ncbi:MAG TPA: glycogen debranching N-terminal domain-containing protein, partial [Acidimicrobiales bacterium]|nr:glycogen debranching N-terminal domain-containing protein [Acidimicrobiales bacterium]